MKLHVCLMIKSERDIKRKKVKSQISPFTAGNHF